MHLIRLKLQSGLGAISGASNVENISPIFVSTAPSEVPIRDLTGSPLPGNSLKRFAPSARLFLELAQNDAVEIAVKVDICRRDKGR